MTTLQRTLFYSIDLRILFKKNTSLKLIALKKLSAISALVLIFVFCGEARGEVYVWGYSNYPFPTALEGCKFSVYYSQGNDSQIIDNSIRVHSIYYNANPVRVTCDWNYEYIGNSGIKYTVENIEGVGMFRIGDSCASGLEYNYTTGTCGHDNALGKPEALACAGNPISVASGNKYQAELEYLDKDFVLERFYNSYDGAWRTSFTDRIINSPTSGRLMLQRSDGTVSFYFSVNGVLTRDGRALGELSTLASGWRYLSESGEELYFNAEGWLYQYIDPSKRIYNVSLTYRALTVSYLSSTLTISIDALGQPLSVQAPGGSISYTYDDGVLQSLYKTIGGKALSRQFLHEKSRNRKLLTGIIDERGVRFATWTYDDQDRAISSQHAGGVGLTQVAYNADGSSTVTNELGKQTVYRFQQVAGVNYVASIEGEPSANCPASNSSYTYNDRGQVLTKTDAKGLVTAYAYNDRGLEISRTEASGTPLARTVTTEWDPDRFLPVRVVEPARTTVYGYDARGRELSRQVISH
ncbi:RHS repeat protein [Pseudomonas petrae]|uniref:RHS repeat protein n=1 Tax=Pseudomonas petrae TaxID=2912190 RepID=A0ABS9I6V1_9PSED|nr:RHS repeat protein [Pseudomonas petrae]MCF7532177.1 RHS repeat protein [Pseudomonas petrae]MCF7543502.1 RHS repeat protein [Pseudomonas petrae]